MAPKPSKNPKPGTYAHHILTLHRRGLSIREIANIVYDLDEGSPWRLRDARMAYVRVVIRQRQGVGRARSLNDCKYLIRKYGGRTVQEAERRKGLIIRRDSGRLARVNYMRRTRRFRAPYASPTP